MTGEEIIAQRKAQAKKNTSKTLTGDDILRSRGANIPKVTTISKQKSDNINSLMNDLFVDNTATKQATAKSTPAAFKPNAINQSTNFKNIAATPAPNATVKKGTVSKAVPTTNPIKAAIVNTNPKNTPLAFKPSVIKSTVKSNTPTLPQAANATQAIKSQNKKDVKQQAAITAYQKQWNDAWNKSDEKKLYEQDKKLNPVQYLLSHGTTSYNDLEKSYKDQFDLNYNEDMQYQKQGMPNNNQLKVVAANLIKTDKNYKGYTVDEVLPSLKNQYKRQIDTKAASKQGGVNAFVNRTLGNITNAAVGQEAYTNNVPANAYNAGKVGNIVADFLGMAGYGLNPMGLGEAPIATLGKMVGKPVENAAAKFIGKGENVLANKVGNAAIKKAIQNQAVNKVVNPILSSAARGAAEMSVMNGGLTAMNGGNVNQVVQSGLEGLGQGALWGSGLKGLGIGVNAAKPIVNNVAKEFTPNPNLMTRDMYNQNMRESPKIEQKTINKPSTTPYQDAQMNIAKRNGEQIYKTTPEQPKKSFYTVTNPNISPDVVTAKKVPIKQPTELVAFKDGKQYYAAHTPSGVKLLNRSSIKNMDPNSSLYYLKDSDSFAAINRNGQISQVIKSVSDKNVNEIIRVIPSDKTFIEPTSARDYKNTDLKSIANKNITMKILKPNKETLPKRTEEPQTAIIENKGGINQPTIEKPTKANDEVKPIENKPIIEKPVEVNQPKVRNSKYKPTSAQLDRMKKITNAANERGYNTTFRIGNDGIIQATTKTDKIPLKHTIFQDGSAVVGHTAKKATIPIDLNAPSEIKPNPETDSFVSAKEANITPEATGLNTKNISKKTYEIKNNFVKEFGLNLKKGGMPSGKTIGTFNTHDYSIRLRKANDIPTLTHELGHFIDDSVSRKLSKVTENKPKLEAELKSMLSPEFAKNYPDNQILSEGVAEFTRKYLFENEKAKSKTPEFYNYFEKTIGKDNVDSLKKFGKDIWDIQNLDPNHTVQSDTKYISDKKSIVKKASEISVKDMVQNVKIYKDKAYTGLIDSYHPLIKAEKIANGKAGVYKIEGHLSRLRGQTEVGYQDIMGNHQVDLSGKSVGKSLSKILEPIHQSEEMRKDFWSYATSRRQLGDYEGLEKPRFNSTYEAAIKQLEAKYNGQDGKPNFKEIFEGDLQKFNQNNLHLSVESGLYSEEQAQKIINDNQNYTNQMRIVDELSKNKYGKGINNAGKDIAKKGGGETIADPEESTIMKSIARRQSAYLNVVKKEFVRDITKNKEMGKYVSLAPKQPSTMNTYRETLSFLNTKGIKITQEELSEIIKTNIPDYMAKNNQVVVYEKGVPIVYDVDPEIFRAFDGLRNDADINIAKTMLTTIAKFQKNMIVATPRFPLWNFARDFVHSLISTEAGINPIDIVKGLKSEVKGDKWAELASRTGGKTAFYDNVRDSSAAKMIKESMADINLTKKVLYYGNPARWLDDFKKLNEPMEAAARTAEQKKFITKYLKSIGYDKKTIDGMSVDEIISKVPEDSINYSVYLMRRLSVDFSRSGRWIKEGKFNAYTNFLNAQIQGIDKAGTMLMPRNIVKTSTRALKYLVIPTMFMYWLNSKQNYYKELPHYRRDNFFNIPLDPFDPNNKVFIPIPKPWEMGLVFSTTTERALDAIKKDPHAWEGFNDSVTQTFALNFMPSAAQPLYDVATNTDYLGRPILSETDKGVDPKYQTNKYTSSVADSVADLNNKLSIPSNNLKSPKIVDHLLKGFGGTLGTMALNSVDQVTGKQKGIPVIGGVANSFTVQAGRSPQSVERFYTYKDKLTKLVGNGKVDTELMKNPKYPEYKGLLSAYNKVAKIIKTIKEQSYKVQMSNNPNKQKLINDYENQIIEITSNMNKYYEKLNK